MDEILRDVNTIKSILEGDYRLSILIAGIKNDSLDYRKLNLTKELVSEFKEMIQNLLLPIVQKVEQGEVYLIDYQPGYKKEKFEIEYINTEEEDYSIVKHHLDSIPNLTNTAVFETSDTDFIKKISYYIVQIKTSEGKTITILRKYMFKKELTKKRNIRAIFKDGLYDSFQEPILLFDEKIDCVQFNKWLYIIDTQQFHFMFQFYEKLAEKANEIITNVTSRLPIKGVDDLKEVCSSQPTMLAKIHSISRKDYIAEVTMDDIQDTIEAFKLNVEIEDGHLVFDKKNRWELLKLLDEHYLGSKMTGRLYDANSKKGVVIS